MPEKRLEEILSYTQTSLLRLNSNVLSSDSIYFEHKSLNNPLTVINFSMCLCILENQIQRLDCALNY